MDRAEATAHEDNVVATDVGLDCGWGTLHFADTYKSSAALADAMRVEGPGRRDIAFYVEEPHVTLSAAPLELFLDPSHAFRLDLSRYEPSSRKPEGYVVRRMANEEDAEAVNRIYAVRGMVRVRPDFFWSKRDSRAFTYLVAEDEMTGAIIGTVTGIDHEKAFGDPRRGTSLWCLAVDPQTRCSGVGEALVRRLAEIFKERGCSTLDLSVLHDNDHAIQLYEKLGFARHPVYTLKRKNPINERLFAGPAPEVDLNPYARIIVEEARRRGIDVEVIDAEHGFFRLTYGGRSIRCRESLSEMTSAVAMSICDDKAVTRNVVEGVGVAVPDEIEANDAEAAREMFERHEKIVIKPARGEQGRGISVGLSADDDVEGAFARAREVCDRVLVEEFVEGDDLRLVVIDHRVVAAAVRRAARVYGDGRSTVRQLDREAEPAQGRGDGRRGIDPHGRGDRTVPQARGPRLGGRSGRRARGSGAADREPAHRRDDPRRDRSRPPGAGGRGDQGVAFDRHPRRGGGSDGAVAPQG